MMKSTKNKLLLMKSLVLIALLGLTACNRSSSPDGRSQIRDEKIQQEIELLKSQQSVILDSIQSLNQQLQQLKQDQK